jgi:TldD protein
MRAGFSLLLLLLLPALPVASARAGSTVDDAAVRRALEDELARSRAELHVKGEPRPYYIGYTVSDLHEARASAVFGALEYGAEYRYRTVRVDLRVGDPRSDDTNFDGSFSTESAPWLVAPGDDDYLTLRRQLWRQTDQAYREALERMAAKRAAAERQAASPTDAPADFVLVKPVNLVDPPPATPLVPSVAPLQERLVKLSAVFRDHPGLNVSFTRVHHEVWRKRHLSSDGSWIDQRSTRLLLKAHAYTQASDGMPLWSWVDFNVATPAELPAQKVMEDEARRVATELEAIREAPLVKSSDAVVLFEGQAAAEMVRRLLGDRLSGTPPARTVSGEKREPGSLRERLGQKVGPAFLSVHDDPLATRGPGGVSLLGAYRADDEGVAAERVQVIQKGMLTALLMGRTPSSEMTRSNGHGRGTPTLGAFQGRISNLFVTGAAGAVLGERKLRERALAVARESGPKTAVYLVRLLDGNPMVAYRLENGRQTPVRGLVLEGLTPRSLKDLVAVGDRPYVHNYVDYGDDRGWRGAPSSIVTPALLFRDVEVRTDTRKPPKPPLYPHPAFAGSPSPRR